MIILYVDDVKNYKHFVTVLMKCFFFDYFVCQLKKFMWQLCHSSFCFSFCFLFYVRYE